MGYNSTQKIDQKDCGNFVSYFLQSAEADFVCIDAVSTAESDLCQQIIDQSGPAVE